MDHKFKSMSSVFIVALIFCEYFIEANGHHGKNSFVIDYKGFQVSGHSENVFINLKTFKNQLEQQPTVTYRGAETDELYSMIMVDPDAPSASNPTEADWLHFGLVNIRGKALKQGKIQPGRNCDVFKDYAGPTPPPQSGPHRYQFLLFQQKQRINPAPLKLFGRAKFNRNAFQTSYEQTLIKQAYFQTENSQR